MSQTIHVIGLGAGTLDQLPLGIYRFLTNHKNEVFVRTNQHPVIQELEEEGVTFKSFDHVYEKHEQFEDVYQDISKRLLEAAQQQDLVYALPGHPFVAERTVQLLLEHADEHLHIEFHGGQSFLDPLFNALKIDPIEGFQLLDGTALKRSTIQFTNHLLIAQVYDSFVASDIKLTLMEDLPEDYPVTIVDAAGSKDEKVMTVPLYELDREGTFSDLTTLYVAPQSSDALTHTFNQLREVIATLRGPNGCPWDRKQTHESLRPYLIEEAYEVIDAIQEEDDDHIAEELGDVLLQVMLHSQIGEDNGFFSVDDVIRSITEKMIERHPHVFGDVEVDSADEVTTNWEAIKSKGKAKKETLLEGISEALPRLLYAQEMQKKASKVGFDWGDAALAFEKVTEEIKELQEVIEKEDINEIELEFGDVLFSLVNVARLLSIDSEIALHRTSQKFKNRFQYIESIAKRNGVELTDLSLEDMENYWNQAKVLRKGEE
ncbi:MULTISPECIES: nucleoside triphosphate pyrophosphohydrolase [Allobacillus]|uniref:Nucleoside triphosphate pyrophosphohydrolase n=1 Tax=Allobacillus salarius TaxID=1955272 RepID=A0A556PBP5_9BACI|nr:nucleoside triphosphate pyrophosphohydrolase [Allobacillus salarius]TSJ61814.1 nucleoside triphosphate pyrophosphohydrolase [Allobacillus salarius]